MVGGVLRLRSCAGDPQSDPREAEHNRDVKAGSGPGTDRMIQTTAPQQAAKIVTAIISVRRRNWKRRRLRFGGSALDCSACMAALSPTAGSRGKGFWRPYAGGSIVSGESCSSATPSEGRSLPRR